MHILASHLSLVEGRLVISANYPRYTIYFSQAYLVEGHVQVLLNGENSRKSLANTVLSWGNSLNKFVKLLTYFENFC